MADFSFLSDDSDNEKAVNELLSQAMDQSILEQVAAINCSGFTDSVLPTQLETRFHKLKSLPTVPTIAKQPSNFTRNSKSLPKTKKSYDDDDENEENQVEEKGFKVDLEHEFDQEQDKKGQSDAQNIPHSKRVGVRAAPEEQSNDGFDKTPDGKKDFKVNLEHDFVKKQFDTQSISDSGRVGGRTAPKEQSKDFFLENPDRRKGKKTRSLSFSSDSWDFSKDCNLSPPNKSGCFWCSPKKRFSKKGKENKGLKWGKDDEILSDLSTFSSKNQEKLMKKAMMEQEKINREAEKIVKWAKQASARMDVSSIEDEFSDDDSFK